MLSAKRDGKAAERFFRKVLKASHTQTPRVITVDENTAYPEAIETLKANETLPETTELRQKKYSNNIRSARSPSHKTTGVGRYGVQIVQHGPTHTKRIRSANYDQERTNSGS